MIRLKNVRPRQYQRSRDHVLKRIQKDLQKNIDHRLTLLRNEKFARKVLKKPPKPIPSLKDGVNIILTNEEKAQKLAQQFENAHNFNLIFLSPIEDQISIDFQIFFVQQVSLIKVFNKCFDLAYFPSSWKNAKVI